MRLAMAFLVGFLGSATVFLAAAQAPSELGRYQISTASDTAGGRVFQVDTYTGRRYARDWYQGWVYDLGTLAKPLARPEEGPPAKPSGTKAMPPKGEPLRAFVKASETLRTPSPRPLLTLELSMLSPDSTRFKRSSSRTAWCSTRSCRGWRAGDW